MPEIQERHLYSTVIFTDSIVYRFAKDNFFLADTQQKTLGWPASYRGEIKDLENHIRLRYEKEKDTKEKTDSIYVFKCMVLRNDSLADIEQIVGKPSLLSDIITQEFRKNSRSWQAAVLETSGLRHDTFIRVLARLNDDGSVTIKTPMGLHTFAGY